MKKTLSAIIAASVALTGLTATPAFARHHDDEYGYDQGNYRGNDDGYPAITRSVPSMFS